VRAIGGRGGALSPTAGGGGWRSGHSRGQWQAVSSAAGAASHSLFDRVYGHALSSAAVWEDNSTQRHGINPARTHPPCRFLLARVAAAPPTLLDLPNQVLDCIAAQLDQPSRARLAGCCRRLLAASEQGSKAWWETVTMMLWSDGAPQRLATWLARRRPATRVLNIDSLRAHWMCNIKLPELPQPPREWTGRCVVLPVASCAAILIEV